MPRGGGAAVRMQEFEWIYWGSGDFKEIRFN